MDMVPWPEKDNTERWQKPWCFLILCKKQPGQWEGCELWVVDLGGGAFILYSLKEVFSQVKWECCLLRLWCAHKERRLALPSPANWVHVENPRVYSWPPLGRSVIEWGRPLPPGIFPGGHVRTEPCLSTAWRVLKSRCCLEQSKWQEDERGQYWGGLHATFDSKDEWVFSVYCRKYWIRPSYGSRPDYGSRMRYYGCTTWGRSEGKY